MSHYTRTQRNFVFIYASLISLLFFSAISKLGPAEVAAWGVLGIIWEQLELFVQSFAESCEVHCAQYLGSGDPKLAKLVSYKAVWLCFVWAIVVTVVFNLFGKQIPALLTDDILLQRIIAENLPLVGFANVVASIAVCAEYILSGMNRVVLSAALGLTTTAFVSLPLGALSSIVYNFDLKGQMAGMVVSYSMLGATSISAIISSDWEYASKDVISLHRDPSKFFSEDEQ